MWNVQNVTGGFSLLAFLAAMGYLAYKAYLKQQTDKTRDIKGKDLIAALGQLEQKPDIGKLDNKYTYLLAMRRADLEHSKHLRHVFLFALVALIIGIVSLLLSPRTPVDLNPKQSTAPRSISELGDDVRKFTLPEDQRDKDLQELLNKLENSKDQRAVVDELANIYYAVDREGSEDWKGKVQTKINSGINETLKSKDGLNVFREILCDNFAQAQTIDFTLNFLAFSAGTHLEDSRQVLISLRPSGSGVAQKARSRLENTLRVLGL